MAMQVVNDSYVTSSIKTRLATETRVGTLTGSAFRPRRTWCA